MATSSFKCPECGGDRITALGSNSFHCEYCGTNFSNTSEPPVQSAQPAMTRCPYCGGEILLGAQKCLHCGEWLTRQPAPAAQPQQTIQQPQKSSKSKTTAFLLALFFGGWGAHKFYLGKKGAGATYLIIWLFTFWTVFMLWVLWGIAFIEGISILCMSDEAFDKKYNC